MDLTSTRLTISPEQDSAINDSQTVVSCVENQNRCPNDAQGAHSWLWATIEKGHRGRPAGARALRRAVLTLQPAAALRPDAPPMNPIKTLVDRAQGKAPAGARRSSRWPSVRRAFLAKNPACAVCGGRKKLEVHHRRPFHEAPELELEESNLIVLCEAKSYGIVCHLAIGHLGSYRRANPDVEKDAAFWAAKLKRGA